MTNKSQTFINVRPLLIARLRLSVAPLRPLPLAAHVRGALAELHPELDLLHQHGTDGLIYRSPRVIYTVDDNGPLITAIEEGAEALMNVRLVGRSIRLGAAQRQVIDSTLKVSQEDLGQSKARVQYQFRRPWLALNQKNHRRYEQLPEPERSPFLNRQLCNNCLALARSFGVSISEHLVADSNLRPVTTRHKGLPMMGFVGTFSINFHVPEDMGLGKTVSKGFGNVARVSPCS